VKQQLVSFPFGGGAPTPLFESEPEMEYGASSVTSDGRTLLFTAVPLRDKVGDIMTIDLEAGRVPKRFMSTPEAEWDPLISPSDDVVLYCVSNDETRGAVLKVVAYPTPSAPVQVSPTITTAVYGWLSAGEIYWVDLSLKVWSAPVSIQGGQLDVGAPKPMFDGQPLGKEINIVAYDLPRERFLIAIEDSAREDAQLILVSDWRPEAVGTQAVRN